MAIKQCDEIEEEAATTEGGEGTATSEPSPSQISENVYLGKNLTAVENNVYDDLLNVSDASFFLDPQNMNQPYPIVTTFGNGYIRHNRSSDIADPLRAETKKFFVSEIIIIKATLVNNISTFNNNGEIVTLEREGWIAETDDINLASSKDNYFFSVELLLLSAGLYFSLKQVKGLREQAGLVWHLAKFELRQGITSPRMIVLGVIFTLFIIGMGWLLGDLQNGDPESAFFVQNANGALQQLCFFVFFVVSLAAIGVSVDAFHKERQANTINILLAKPINRETIVIGKALGLSLVVGIPALVAQILGLIFMINAGDTPSFSGIIAFLICGQIMIFTLVCFQLCFAISARSGTDVVMYGLGMWLLFAVVWNLLIYALSFALGIDVTADDFENDPKFQTIASHMGMLNPGYVYQFAVGLLTHRTLAIDLEGIPGWLILLALVLWPITCLRTAAKLFKKEVKG